MNRRGFLGVLGAAVVGATLDPERALWEPGKRLISIPKVQGCHPYPILELGDVITFSGLYRVNPLTREITSELQRFVCIEAGTHYQFPRIILRGPYQNCAAPSGDYSRIPDISINFKDAVEYPS